MEKREKEKCLRLSHQVVNPHLFVYPSLVEVDRSGIGLDPSLVEVIVFVLATGLIPLR